jgi:ribosomal 50S subunit-associated protein YjgA (DUF615 family)
MSFEFHYIVTGRSRGQRPGAHAGRSEGTGQLFASHRRLLDHPDPRRIDVRASLRDLRGEWLVRIARQRVAVQVQVIADVSASMHLGTPRRKLELVADFIEGLGLAAYRAGDAIGIAAFDGTQPHARADLLEPARRGRGMGTLLAQRLRELPAPATARRSVGGEGLVDAARTVASARREGLVFIASDFHGVDVAHIDAALDALWPAQVVPLLAWHPDETEPPAGRGLLPLSDAETARRRSLWMRASLRQRWVDGVRERRDELERVFRRRECPLHPLIDARGRFEAETLTRYFHEHR